MLQQFQREELMFFLTQGVEEATRGNKNRARIFLDKALDLDKGNETAMLWVAWITDNPRESIGILERILQKNPRNNIAKVYLNQARDKLNSTGYLRQIEEQNRRKKTDNLKIVPLIGEYMIRKGYISYSQLSQGLARQKMLSQQGIKEQLGQILVEMGYINLMQLEEGLQSRLIEYYV
jgi:hypothetical protein